MSNLSDDIEEFRASISANAPDDWAPNRSFCWEVHQGHVRIFIVGPGERAWFPASKVQYLKKDPETGRWPMPATPQELELANKTVGMLRETGRTDQGPEEIEAMMKLAASGGKLVEQVSLPRTGRRRTDTASNSARELKAHSAWAVWDA